MSNKSPDLCGLRQVESPRSCSIENLNLPAVLVKSDFVSEPYRIQVIMQIHTKSVVGCSIHAREAVAARITPNQGRPGSCRAMPGSRVYISSVSMLEHILAVSEK